MGFNTFEEAAFESGLVKTMLTITQDTRTGQWPALSGYFALQLMWHLTKTGTSDERRALIKELMDHNALEIILDVGTFSPPMVVFFWIILICTPLPQKIESHPLVSHRQCAVNVLRCLTSESFLGEALSSKQMSDVMLKLSRYILAGHELFSAQMLNPTTTWQSFLCFGQFGVHFYAIYFSLILIPRFTAPERKGVEICSALLCHVAGECIVGNTRPSPYHSSSKPAILPRSLETRPRAD